MIQHSVHDSDNRVVLGDECRRLGIGDFCARMVCQIDSSSNGRKGVILKYHIILFPVNADDLQESPECQYAGWPGIRISEGTMPFRPKPTEPWKCPCVPLIRPGVPFKEVSLNVRSSRIRFAVGAVMNKAGQPDILGSGGAVLQKWEQIRTNPLSIFRANQLTTWPDTALESEESGKTWFFQF